MHWILYEFLDLTPSYNLRFILLSSLIAIGAVLVLGWFLIFLFSSLFNPKQHPLFNRLTQIRLWWANVYLLLAFLLSIEVLVSLWYDGWFTVQAGYIPVWVALAASLVLSGLVIGPYRAIVRECRRVSTAIDSTKL
ncbi:MAG: hypothetical protein KDH98_08530 [Calditrichaeota bacterium]|nr:hypothetical protein [Calditrichota bacterium]